VTRPCTYQSTRDELPARGTRNWTLRLPATLPRDHFVIRVDAIDALHQHHYS
jgi:hypothetical protein